MSRRSPRRNCVLCRSSTAVVDRCSAGVCRFCHYWEGGKKSFGFPECQKDAFACPIAPRDWSFWPGPDQPGYRPRRRDKRFHRRHANKRTDRIKPTWDLNPKAFMRRI